MIKFSGTISTISTNQTWFVRLDNPIDDIKFAIVRPDTPGRLGIVRNAPVITIRRNYLKVSHSPMWIHLPPRFKHWKKFFLWHLKESVSELVGMHLEGEGIRLTEAILAKNVWIA